MFIGNFAEKDFSGNISQVHHEGKKEEEEEEEETHQNGQDASD